MKLGTLISKELRDKLAAHAIDNDAKRLLQVIKSRHIRKSCQRNTK
jgi:hypothetical protein